MKKKIHVNQTKIKQNTKQNLSQPVITCKTYKENLYGNRVKIFDDNGNVIAEVVSIYDEENRKQLSCGARVWIETDYPVEVDGVPMK